MKDKIVLSSFADLLINLAAGWFVIAVTIPFSSASSIQARFGLLLVNLGFSIICFVIAVWLRRIKKW